MWHKYKVVNPNEISDWKYKGKLVLLDVGEECQTDTLKAKSTEIKDVQDKAVGLSLFGDPLYWR